MSKRKYTDEEIVKALECCINADCLNCPRWSGEWYSGMCNDFLKSVLDLFNRKNAEIDKLQEVNADLNESLRLAAEANKDLKAEVEEWKARANDWQNQYLKLIEEMEIYQEHIDQDIIYAKAIKAEAIKEFAERFKKKTNVIVARRDGVEIYETKLYQIRATSFDDLVAEMTEGE